MLEAKNNWYLNTFYGLINNVLFLDLDPVDHSILLKKLQLLRDQIIPLRSLPEYFFSMKPYQTIFLSAVGSHKVLYLDPYYFSFI